MIHSQTIRFLWHGRIRCLKIQALVPLPSSAGVLNNGIYPFTADRRREDLSTAKEKFDAVIRDVKEAHAKHQPVLVGTASIETSELLSSLLKKEGIKHEVLNAKQHEREAEIVAQAGRPGGVTIATNMAGRGTDIVLGGSLESDRTSL